VSNIYQLPTPGRCHDEASEWLAKLDRGLSADEEHALNLWVRQSAEHRAALLKLASLWDRMDSLSLLSELFPRPARQPKTLRRYYPAIAASALFAVIVVAWQLAGPSFTQFSRWWRPDNVVAIVDGIYETAIGEQFTVDLPDDSRLVLNTNSLIKVVYSDKQRLLILERGEMNIEVAHDAERPLSVMAGQKIVQAVGTAFNVQIINDSEVELIVTAGKVLVAERGDIKGDTGAKAAGNAVKPLSDTSTLVSKGERVVLGAGQEAIAKVSDSDISAQLSWRQGNLVFRGETLAEAVVELGRYTPVKFELADEKLAGIRIGGRFKAGDVEGLLATLKENFEIDYERPDAERVLLKAR
jgi:transmembrane sensor